MRVDWERREEDEECIVDGFCFAVLLPRWEGAARGDRTAGVSMVESAGLHRGALNGPIPRRFYCKRLRVRWCLVSRSPVGYLPNFLFGQP